MSAVCADKSLATLHVVGGVCRQPVLVENIWLYWHDAPSEETQVNTSEYPERDASKGKETLFFYYPLNYSPTKIKKCQLGVNQMNKIHEFID